MKIKFYLVFGLIILITQVAKAQHQSTAIQANLGFGSSIPTNSTTEFSSFGFYADANYILKYASWFEMRPYAALIFSSSDGTDVNNNPTHESIKINAFMTGGKARVRIPIKYVAPYFELGIGFSIGEFETLTDFNQISKTGIIYHIPTSFGLEVGRNNGVDIGFSFYSHPTVSQFTGAFAVGFTFPLRNTKNID